MNGCTKYRLKKLKLKNSKKLFPMKDCFLKKLLKRSFEQVSTGMILRSNNMKLKKKFP